jgi:GNAT superfamily N-acetyltransferase
MLSEPRESARDAGAIRDYFQRAVPTGEFVAYLASREGRIVGVGGMAVGELPPTSPSASRRTGCILNMYTLPEARRTGVAEAILGLLIREGRELGLSHLHLRATEQGVALYRKAGFGEPRFLEMELTIGPVPPVRPA